MCNGYTYHNCLAEIQCNPPHKCFVGNCDECPGVTKLQNRLEQHLDKHMNDRVEFKQWTTTVETNVLSADEFHRVIRGSLPGALLHDFIAKQQSQYLQKTKSMLCPHEFLIIGDFAENYSFVL